MEGLSHGGDAGFGHNSHQVLNNPFPEDAGMDQPAYKDPNNFDDEPPLLEGK